MPVSVLKKPSNRNLRNSRSNLTGSYDNFNKSKTVSRSRYDGNSSKEKQRLKQAIKHTKAAVSRTNQVFKANHENTAIHERALSFCRKEQAAKDKMARDQVIASIEKTMIDEIGMRSDYQANLPNEM